MSFVPFPSIEQFKNLVRAVQVRATYVGKGPPIIGPDGTVVGVGDNVYDSTKKKPTLTLRGTVKVHGTNAAVSLLPSGEIVAQSRSQVLVAPQDNAGFRAFVETVPKTVWAELFFQVASLCKVGEATLPLTIFGEWAGQGIQSGVGVSQVEKFFYMFAAKAGEQWLDISSLQEPTYDLPEKPDYRIYNALNARFPRYEVVVNFDDQEALANARNQMVEITNAVEKECPVAKELLFYAHVRAGLPAVDFKVPEGCIGEGVVWTCVTPGFEQGFIDERGVEDGAASSGGSQGLLWCKVKGEKHSASKVKTLAPLDVEKVRSVQEFIDRTVTENRLNQGLDALRAAGKPTTMASTGDFIRWITADILKEESDTMLASGLTAKDVGAGAGPRSQRWYKAYCERLPAELPVEPRLPGDAS